MNRLPLREILFVNGTSQNTFIRTSRRCVWDYYYYRFKYYLKNICIRSTTHRRAISCHLFGCHDLLLLNTKYRPATPRSRVTRDTRSRYDVCEQFVADYGKLRGNKNRYLMVWAAFLDVAYFFRVCECCSEIRKMSETMAKVSQAHRTRLDRAPSMNRCGR